MFEELKAKAVTNEDQGKKTAVVFAYNGKGACLEMKSDELNDNEPMTSALLNFDETFDVEQKLRDLSKMPGVFVLAVLDCDRTIEISDD